uniref:Uncharacterized protein n=1 Tax=Salmo trutta TaxID=8032 RepID=A0A674AWQ7_SALTR
MASITKRTIPSAFYRLGLVYLFLNFPNIWHITYLYHTSIAYLAYHYSFVVLACAQDCPQDASSTCEECISSSPGCSWCKYKVSLLI